MSDGTDQNMLYVDNIYSKSIDYDRLPLWNPEKMYKAYVRIYIFQKHFAKKHINAFFF